MKDLDMMHYFLGMEVWHSADGIPLGQGKYAVEILKKFKILETPCFYVVFGMKYVAWLVWPSLLDGFPLVLETSAPPNSVFRH